MGKKRLGRKEKEHRDPAASLAFILLTHLGLRGVAEWKQSGHSTELSEGSRLEGHQAAEKVC